MAVKEMLSELLYIKPLNKFMRFNIKDIHLQELLKGSSVSFVFRILGIAVGYVFTLLITKNFGADTMGIFTLSFTVLGVFSVVGKLGFNTALLRFVAEYSSQNKMDFVKEVYIKAIKIVTPLCLLLSVLLYFLAPYIARYIFHKEYLAVYFRIVSFVLLPIVLVDMNAECLRGLKKIKEYSFFQNIAVFLFASIFLGIALILFNEGYVPVIAYALSITFVSMLSLFVWINRSKLTSISYAKNIKTRTILDVSLPTLISGSLFLVMSWTDTIMLGMFGTEGDVGVYNVASRVSSLANISLCAVNSIAAPKFAESYNSGDVRGFEKVIHQSTKLGFWSSLPIFFVLFLFPSFMLGMFGGEFKSGACALLLLTIGQFINVMSGSVAYILQMSGKQKVFQKIILVSTMINIVLNAILIPKYSISGAAISSTVSMIFWNVSSVVYIKKYLNVFTVYVPVIARRP